MRNVKTPYLRQTIPYGSAKELTCYTRWVCGAVVEWLQRENPNLNGNPFRVVFSSRPSRGAKEIFLRRILRFDSLGTDVRWGTGPKSCNGAVYSSMEKFAKDNLQLPGDGTPKRFFVKLEYKG